MKHTPIIETEIKPRPQLSKEDKDTMYLRLIKAEKALDTIKVDYAIKTDLPQLITMREYDILMRELWEMKQRLAAVEKQFTFDTNLDELYKQNAMIKKMLTKIGTRLFRKAIQ